MLGSPCLVIDDLVSCAFTLLVAKSKEKRASNVPKLLIYYLILLEHDNNHGRQEIAEPQNQKGETDHG